MLHTKFCCFDVINFFQMTSIRPYTRKRSVLISYKIFLNYPEALRPAFPRLKEKLEDPDTGFNSFNFHSTIKDGFRFGFDCKTYLIDIILDHKVSYQYGCWRTRVLVDCFCYCE